MQTPGPRGLAVLKNIVDFYRDPLEQLTNLAEDYGDLSAIKLGPMIMYQLVQPGHVLHVLQNHADNYKMGDTFEQTGHGLTTLDGELWQQHRRIMQPVFQHHHLAYVLPYIHEILEKTRARWLNQGIKLNIGDEMLFLHHQILGKVLFGVDFESPEDTRLTALREVRHYMARRIHGIVTVPENWPTPRNREYAKNDVYLRNFIREKIHETQNAATPQPTILYALLHAEDNRTGDSLNETELIDELMDLFFAAYEDPANVWTWALYELSQHADVAEKLRAEVSRVLDSETPTLENFRKLTYTRHVVDEILRLYPPTWSLMRNAVEADVIDGHQIVSGAMVLINIYLAHRSPAYWKEPATFKPDRFATDETLFRFVFYPFGGGPRRCIGSSLAMVELVTGLAYLMQNFTWDLLPESKIRMIVHNSLQPAHTIWMNARPREV